MRDRVAFTVALVLMAAACQGTSDEPVAATSVGAPSTTIVVSGTSTTTALEGRAAFRLPAGFDLQGHRGARGLKPENTLPAFETALDLMVTTLEFDLHLSADDEIVVWHDPVVAPSKCGLGTGAPSDVPDPDDASLPDGALAIRSLTVEQLSWYQCNRNPDPARFTAQDAVPTPFAGEKYSIVTLDGLVEFVERYAADESKSGDQRRAAAVVRFNMETKRNSADPGAIGDAFDGENPGLFESRVLEIVEDRNISERTTIQSFDIRSLLAIRGVDPNIALAFLESTASVDLGELASWGITEWSPNLDLVTEQSVTEAHEAGLAVKPWTIASVDQAVALLDVGVDGLITDRPDLFFVSR